MASASSQSRLTTPKAWPTGMNDGRLTPPASLRRDLLIFAVLGALGVLAAYFAVNIPHTALYIEGRWAFGFMGVALIRRFGPALLLAGLLSAVGFHAIPMSLCFMGNMLYALPALAVIRPVHERLLSRIDSLALYGIGWMLLMVFCYQAFNTPITWAIVAVLEGNRALPAVLESWREQPYIIEMLLVGIVSALGMAVFRVHETLRLSRRELAITLDSIGDGVIATDAQGRVTRMNPVARELTGWSLAEARGKDFRSVFRIVDDRTRRPAFNSVEQVLKENKAVHLGNGTILISRDGTERHIADSIAPLKDVNGRCIGAVLVFRDVTREYESNHSLLHSQSMLARTERIAHIGSWEWEIATDTVTWSEELYRIFGLEPTGPAPTFAEHTRLYHPDDMAALASAAEAAISEGTPYELEMRAFRADGEVRLCLARGFMGERGPDGRAIRLYGSLQDITERKRAETALRENEDKYRTLIELSPDLIAVHQDGRFRFINRAGCEMLGVDGPEAVIGRPVQDFVPPERRDESHRRIRRVIHAGGRSPVYEQRLCRADGTERTIEVVGIPIDYEGEPAIQIIARDITEQLRMNEENARLEERFHQAQKLESVGRLAGGVAHDLNNLLSPILGYGEMLLGDLSESDERRASVSEIVGAGQRARDLVRQLLAFSRKQTLSLSPIDLNEVLARFETLLRRTIREDIAIEVHTAPALPPVRGDIGQLEQVIMNLSVNAQDAMPDGGTLTIETAVADLDEDYAAAHEGARPGRYVMLGVSDTGVGMDIETRRHVFEPFFTTKAKDKGTGLGLATCYGIIKQHGGNIWVYSEESQGTTFKIYLPVCGAPAAAEKSPTPPPPAARGGETVLLVEDNEAVRNLAGTILTRQGYTVLTAENGTDALKVLENHGGPVHLLLTDVIMPEMNGRDLFARLSAQYPDLRVLFMSGYTDNVIAHQGVMDPDVSFIQKPFSVQGLAAKVRAVIDGTDG